MTTVILLKAQKYGSGEYGKLSLGLTTIGNALRKNNFHEVYHVNNLREADSVLGGNSGKVIFGISSTTDEYPEARKLCKEIKKEYRDSVVVLGGPHFQTEKIVDASGKVHPGTVELALQDKSVDAVVVGQAQPFIDLIVKHGGEIDKVDSRGIYYVKADGTIAGKGRGEFPQLELVPYDFYVAGEKAGMIIDPRCPNGCSFCSFDQWNPRLTEGKISQSLKKLYEKYYIYNYNGNGLDLFDSNPFISDSGKMLFEVLEGNKELRDIKKVAYLDPAALLHRSSEEFLEKLIHYGFVSLFVGKDAAGLKSAESIGRKLKGKVRSQEELDQEKAALLKLFSEIKKKGLSFRFNLSYILSPFDSKEDIFGMLDEMLEMENASEDNLKVVTRLQQLTPYPGTGIRKEYLDYLANPEDYSSNSICSHPWNPEKIGGIAKVLDLFKEDRLSGYKGRIIFPHARDNFFAQLKKAVELAKSNRGAEISFDMSDPLDDMLD